MSRFQQVDITGAVEFKPQAWHVEIRHLECDPNCKHNFVEAGLETRKVAEEVRDKLNDTLRQSNVAIICLCDCPNRECKYL